VENYERFTRGLNILRNEGMVGLEEYVRSISKDDPVVSRILGLRVLVARCYYAESIREGRALLADNISDIRFLSPIMRWIGLSAEAIGELNLARNYYQRALEISEELGDTVEARRLRIRLLLIKIREGRYPESYSEIAELLDEIGPNDENYQFLQMQAAGLEIAFGRRDSAKKRLKSILSSDNATIVTKAASEEFLGVIYRLSGEYQEALRYLVNSARTSLAQQSAYACYPIAKACEITALAGLEPPDQELVQRCLAMKGSGDLQFFAASSEIKALLGESPDAAGIFKASLSYTRCCQPFEAFLSGICAAWLAWREDLPVFTKIVKFLAPLAQVHRGLFDDSLTCGFARTIEPLLRESTPAQNREAGIRAYLVEGPRVIVDGKEVSLTRWGSKKAIKAFLYLLLSPKHAIAHDHLFYLLWPKDKLNSKTRANLYVIVNLIRKNLGNPALLKKKGEFYYLESTWTDLGEAEALLLKAEAAENPERRKSLLMRANDLLAGEILPGFDYDEFVDDYRRYYRSLRQKIASMLKD